MEVKNITILLIMTEKPPEIPEPKPFWQMDTIMNTIKLTASTNSNYYLFSAITGALQPVIAANTYAITEKSAVSRDLSSSTS